MYIFLYAFIILVYSKCTLEKKKIARLFKKRERKETRVVGDLFRFAHCGRRETQIRFQCMRPKTSDEIIVVFIDTRNSKHTIFTFYKKKKKKTSASREQMT